MARAGFIYMPQEPGDDLATCLYCGVSLSGWDDDDDPLCVFPYFLSYYSHVFGREEHLKRVKKANDNCPIFADLSPPPKPPPKSKSKSKHNDMIMPTKGFDGAEESSDISSMPEGSRTAKTPRKPRATGKGAKTPGTRSRASSKASHRSALTEEDDEDDTMTAPPPPPRTRKASTRSRSASRAPSVDDDAPRKPSKSRSKSKPVVETEGEEDDIPDPPPPPKSSRSKSKSKPRTVEVPETVEDEAPLGRSTTRKPSAKSKTKADSTTDETRSKPKRIPETEEEESEIDLPPPKPSRSKSKSRAVAEREADEDEIPLKKSTTRKPSSRPPAKPLPSQDVDDDAPAKKPPSKAATKSSRSKPLPLPPDTQSEDEAVMTKKALSRSTRSKPKPPPPDDDEPVPEPLTKGSSRSTRYKGQPPSDSQPEDEFFGPPIPEPNANKPVSKPTSKARPKPTSTQRPVPEVELQSEEDMNQYVPPKTPALSKKSSKPRVKSKPNSVEGPQAPDADDEVLVPPVAAPAPSHARKPSKSQATKAKTAETGHEAPSVPLHGRKPSSSEAHSSSSRQLSGTRNNGLSGPDEDVIMEEVHGRSQMKPNGTSARYNVPHVAPDSGNAPHEKTRTSQQAERKLASKTPLSSHVSQSGTASDVERSEIDAGLKLVEISSEEEDERDQPPQKLKPSHSKGKGKGKAKAATVGILSESRNQTPEETRPQTPDVQMDDANEDTSMLDVETQPLTPPRATPSPVRVSPPSMNPGPQDDSTQPLDAGFQFLPPLALESFVPLESLTEAELSMTVEEWIRYQMGVEYEKFKQDGERELAAFERKAEEVRKAIEAL